jgi:Ca2+-binding EF-hand superfamily protein
MKLLNTLVIAALGAGLTLSLPALANHDSMGEHCKMHTKKTFEEADTDKDGTLDKAEAKTMCDKNFEKMDTDKDGTVSKDEMKACGEDMGGMHHHDKKSDAKHEKRSKEFSAADTDADGTLTKDEAKKLPKVSKNFDAIDTDKDGTVDREEVHQFMHTHKVK